jgi:hypothetical protein
MPINHLRTVLGGLLASVVLALGGTPLILWMRPAIMAAREAAHMPAVVQPGILNMVELLLTGFLVVWLYAAIRPRFGAGVVTAARSGLAMWACSVLTSTLHLINDNFGLPSSLLILIAIGILPVFVAAGIVGAWTYRE